MNLLHSTPTLIDQQHEFMSDPTLVAVVIGPGGDPAHWCDQFLRNVGRPRTSINRRVAARFIVSALDLARLHPVIEVADVEDVIEQAVAAGWTGVR